MFLAQVQACNSVPEQIPEYENGTSPDVIFVVITYIINDVRYGEFDDYPLK
ncbi:TPA: umuD domain protein [Escherichia fergusonii]|nr:umuD domain protein [Escherichia fergusonii]HAJ6531067.1 umuD domain protein [Escherichia fergusonii]HAJ6561156.1 umuD domain protein [Escherichia fergusonii]HAJ6570683.1 umuD domain protein [Escherichia fergusonii]